MPKQFEIRPAQLTDCAQILDLIKELALYEKEPDAVETTVKDLEEALFVGSNTLPVFNGEIKDMVIINRPLSVEEIAVIFIFHQQK